MAKIVKIFSIHFYDSYISRKEGENFLRIFCIFCRFQHLRSNFFIWPLPLLKLTKKINWNFDLVYNKNENSEFISFSNVKNQNFDNLTHKYSRKNKMLLKFHPPQFIFFFWVFLPKFNNS